MQWNKCHRHFSFTSTFFLVVLVWFSSMTLIYKSFILLIFVWMFHKMCFLRVQLLKTCVLCENVYASKIYCQWKPNYWLNMKLSSILMKLSSILFEICRFFFFLVQNVNCVRLFSFFSFSVVSNQINKFIKNTLNCLSRKKIVQRNSRLLKDGREKVLLSYLHIGLNGKTVDENGTCELFNQHNSNQKMGRDDTTRFLAFSIWYAETRNWFSK